MNIAGVNGVTGQQQTVVDNPKFFSANFLRRFISALIMAPLAVAIVLHGGLVFVGATFLIGLIGFHEWMRMVGTTAPAPISPWVRGIGYFFLLTGCFSGLMAGQNIIGYLFACFLFLVFTLGFMWRSKGGWQIPLALTLGLLYLGAFIFSMVIVAGDPQFWNPNALLYLLATVWATDIGAYAAGRLIGGPKLAPVISPNKTWAGLIGGMLLAAACGYGFSLFRDAGTPWIMASFALVLAFVAQAGDLFESAAKRKCGVKDSGQLIPGHGGVLDRIDGLIFAATAMATAYLQGFNPLMVY